MTNFPTMPEIIDQLRLYKKKLSYTDTQVATAMAAVGWGGTNWSPGHVGDLMIGAVQPTEDEIENNQSINFDNLSSEKASCIYKMVSSTGAECHFIPNRVSTLIKNYDTKTKLGEFGSLNKMEIDVVGNRIKEICWKLEVDRLGNIISVIK